MPGLISSNPTRYHTVSPVSRLCAPYWRARVIHLQVARFRQYLQHSASFFLLSSPYSMLATFRNVLSYSKQQLGLGNLGFRGYG